MGIVAIHFLPLRSFMIHVTRIAAKKSISDIAQYITEELERVVMPNENEQKSNTAGRQLMLKAIVRHKY